MKLQETELNEMRNIVEKYSVLQNEFEITQKELEVINKKKDELLKKLDEVHSEELSFFDSLKEKYGEGKIDLNKLEYIKS